MSNNIKPFITRAALTLALAMLTAATGWAQTTESVTYIDADGNEQTVTATVLTGNETSNQSGSIDLAAGWYVVKGEVNDFLVFGFSIHGNVNIILADGCSFKVPGSSSWTSDAGFTGTGNLTFYGQTAGTGTVSPCSDAPFINVLNGDVTLCSGNIDISNNTHDAISLTGTFTVLGGSVSVKTAGSNGVYRQTAIKAGAVDIRGGSVTASGPNAIEATTVNISGGTVKAYTNGGDAEEEEYGFAIMCNTFNFSGGNVTAGYEYIYDGQTRVGIDANHINLSWTSPTDRILSEKKNDNTISYYGTVTIAQGKPFKVGSTTYMGTLTEVQKEALANQTLEPDLSLAATGDGSAAHPYYINATETWNDFCDALQDNDTWNRFSGKTVKLGTNITVTRMAGSGDNPFCGNFDGGGNTLTFTATAADNYCAPFVGVKGGTTADDATTISNLNVVTTITANDYRHMAGLIALQWGHVNVSGCNSTVNISSTVGDSNPHNLYPAALVSQASSDNGGTLTVTGCTASGTISTDGKYAAGLVGIVQGTASISDCISSVTINSSTRGDGTHGGIVAVVNGSGTITGCVFNGKLLSKNTGNDATTNCAGFVAWGNGTISNCLYAPANIDTEHGETEVLTGDVNNYPSGTFYRGTAPTVSNCYYTRTLGTAQGKQAHSITASGNATLVHAGVATEYSVSGITAYKASGASGDDDPFIAGIIYNNVLYAGSGDAVSLTSTNTAPNGYQLTVTYNDGTANHAVSPDGNGNYTITMPDANVTASANIIVTPWDGDGSEGNPYLIKYASQLDLLAHRVNGTHGETLQTNGYYNTYFQLDNDITYDYTGLGDSDSNFEAIGGYHNGNTPRFFSGHFDGNSKTISGIRIYKDGTGNADKYQGIFGRTNGADIHDLTLADARITGYDNTGGIVGYNEGGTVSNCHVAGDVAVCAEQSDAYCHGGIVGYNKGGTIEQCTSAATLTTDDANNSMYYGGIAGGNYYGTLRDNLAIGATVPATANNSYGAITGYNNGEVTLQRNYYAACKVANVENATGVGCAKADVTDNDGAMPGYFLTLGEGVTSSALSITIPEHKELDDNGQLATVAAVTYNVAAEGTTVWFNSGQPEGYSASYSVNDSPVSGNSITMPAANVTVTSNGGESIDLWGIAGGADGSSDHPYTITKTEGWNLLVGNVAAGKSYSDKYFQLGADNISISTMVGTSACHFSGHFNGNGNTLAVDITSAGEYTAPFRYVGGATITGLHTTGTVTTAHKYATGLVGRHDGNLTISNCRSSVAIVSSVSGDGTHGGFVATGSGTATIEGCLFDGVICTTASDPTNSCGGFVGWNGGTVNISNSLYAPAAVPEGKYAIGTDGCATFARNGAGIANSYYTQVLGDAQGKARHTVTAGTDVTIDAIALTGDETQYTVSGITAYANGGIKRTEASTDTYYYGLGDALSLTLGNTAAGAPLGYQYSAYTASGGTLNGSTLTMPDANVTISVDTSHPHSTHQAVPVGYVDENGIEQTANAVALDGSEQSLAAGTYFVGAPTVSFDHTLTLTGDVTLILADNCHMNVGTSSQPLNVRGINGYIYDLDIYGQSLDENTAGHLNIYTNGNIGLQCKNFNQHSGIVNIDAANAGIYAYGKLDYNTYEYDGGNFTVNGGKLTVNSSNNDAINCRNVTINGGNVSATSTRKSCNAIYSYGSVAINGGIVEATGGDNGNGIVASDGDFNYSGGNVTATATNGTGIRSTGNITLGWKNADDFIDVSSYSLGYGYAVVKVADGQTLIDADGNIYTGTLGTGDNYTAYSVLNGKTLTPAVVLADAANNATAISDAATVCTGGKTIAVQLNGRTLYKDGAWNTLCLPFDVTLADSPLAGAEAKTVIGATTNAGDITINFGNPDSATEPVTVLKAGVPYIIKWEATNTNIVEPVFTGVTVVSSSEAERTVTVADGAVKLVGYYDALSLDPAGSDDFAASIVPSIYYMTADNTLKHTGRARTLRACRAYFQFADEIGSEARDIRLDFGDSETTEILSTTNFTNYTNEAGAWYTVDGVKLDKQPTRKGLYIHNGHKVVIK